MEAGQAQGAMMDTRGFRWRVKPPCALGRSPAPDATPAGTRRPAALGQPSADQEPPAGIGRAPALIGRPELRKRARAPPLAGSGRCPRPRARKSRRATIPSPETMLGQRVAPR